MASEDRGLVSTIGPVQVDWARTAGYYGGIAAAVGFGVLDPPLGIFIAAIPFLKMLNRPGATFPVRMMAQVLDGASKPVGGDSDASITVVHSNRPPQPSHGPGRLTDLIGRETRSIWTDARTLARQNS